MGSVPNLIDELGGYRAVASFLSLPPTTVASWKSRGSIAVEHWPKIVEVARERGVVGVTFDELVALHAAPPEQVAS